MTVSVCANMWQAPFGMVIRRLLSLRFDMRGLEDVKEVRS